jgi:diguanylate cyclase (GGDEF)-like protein
MNNKFQIISALLKKLVSNSIAWFREKGLGMLSVKKSLVNRILILQLVWASFVFIILGVGLWVGIGVLIDQGMNRQAQQWAKELDSIGTRLYVSRKRSLPALKGRMTHWEEVSYVRYLNSKGNRVLYKYIRPEEKKSKLLLPDEQTIKELSFNLEQPRPLRVSDETNNSTARYIYPVRVRTMRTSNILDFDPDKNSREQIRTIGYIEFGVSRARYSEALTESIYFAGVAIGIFFLVSIFVGRFMAIQVLSPLAKLKEPLARLARGERDVLVEHTGDEELDAITEALNITIKAVRERDNSLRRMAEYDSLTGLANRAYFTTALEQEVVRMAREQKSSALFFIDLDQFKYINDTLGHPAGDRLLRQVASALQTRLRDSDLIARFGGDEFTVLARGIDEISAESLANSLLSLLQEMRFVEGGSTLHVHCSIGLTMIESNQFTVEEYLSQVDMACHMAKTDGRNRIAVYKEDEGEQGKMLADMSWSQSIMNALETDNFVLHFQPIVGSDNDKIEKYEVLLRMQDSEGKLIAPNAFLSSAERFGLMPKIDNWVIKQSMIRLAEIRNTGRDVQFSINLSGHIFKNTGTLKFIRQQLDKNDLPAQSVCFEITEQVAVQHLEEASLLMRSLQKIGCEFALDDFGAGYSSLNYIKTLPIDYIKIDGAFISNMHQDPIDQAMVQSFVQIGKTLGKRTVAEYVENLETLTMLKKLGVDYFQGYYVGMPEAEIQQKPLTLKKVKAQG